MEGRVRDVVHTIPSNNSLALVWSIRAPKKIHVGVFVGACLAMLMVVMFNMIMKPTDMINVSDGDECGDDDDDDEYDAYDEYEEYDNDNYGVEPSNADIRISQDSSVC